MPWPERRLPRWWPRDPGMPLHRRSAARIQVASPAGDRARGAATSPSRRHVGATCRRASHSKPHAPAADTRLTRTIAARAARARSDAHRAPPRRSDGVHASQHVTHGTKHRLRCACGAVPSARSLIAPRPMQAPPKQTLAGEAAGSTSNPAQPTANSETRSSPPPSLAAQGVSVASSPVLPDALRHPIRGMTGASAATKSAAMTAAAAATAMAAAAAMAVSARPPIARAGSTQLMPRSPALLSKPPFALPIGPGTGAALGAPPAVARAATGRNVAQIVAAAPSHQERLVASPQEPREGFKELLAGLANLSNAERDLRDRLEEKVRTCARRVPRGRRADQALSAGDVPGPSAENDRRARGSMHAIGRGEAARRTGIAQNAR